MDGDLLIVMIGTLFILPILIGYFKVKDGKPSSPTKF